MIQFIWIKYIKEGCNTDYDYREAMKLKNQLCFPLYAAARNVIGLYTPFLKPLGLTYTQYLVFLVLWEQDKLPVGEICEKLFLDSGTLSPMLKKMQQQGYVEKTRSKEDDRVVVISLTEKGRRLQEKAKHVPMQVARCVSLTPEQGKVLHDLLYELLNNQNEERKAEDEKRI